MKRSPIVRGIIALVIVVASVSYCHVTPEIAIRSNLFFKGYRKEAISTQVYKIREESNSKKIYTCRNPKVGAKYYVLKKKNLGLWFIDWNEVK